MFLDNLKTPGAKNATGVEYAQASEKVEEYTAELDKKERQIQHLSKSVRQWTRKYHELEMTISDSEMHIQEDNDETIRNLQKLILRLNRRNAKLERSLEEAQIESIVKKHTRPKTTSQKNQVTASTETPQPSDSVYPDVIEIEISKEPEASNEEFSQNMIDEEPIELEFSPEMQTILQKHTEKLAKQSSTNSQ